MASLSGASIGVYEPTKACYGEHFHAISRLDIFLFDHLILHQLIDAMQLLLARLLSPAMQSSAVI